MAPKRKKASQQPPKKKKATQPPPASPTPPPEGPKPPDGRHTFTRTNGSQFTVHYQDPETSTDPGRTYDIVGDGSPTGAAAFVTLRIPPQKYRDFLAAATSTISFITLRYNRHRSAAPSENGHQTHNGLGLSAEQYSHSDEFQARPSPAAAPSVLQQQPALSATQQPVHTASGPGRGVASGLERGRPVAPLDTSQVGGENTVGSPQAPSYSPVTPVEWTTSAIGDPHNSVPLQQSLQQQGATSAAEPIQADLPQSLPGHPLNSSQLGVQHQPAASGPLFAAPHLDQVQVATPVFSERELRSRSRSPAPKPIEPPIKKRKIVRLKLPIGYRLDENMTAVRDPNDVSSILKGVVDDLYDVQSKTHGFIPETQNLLIDKIGDITDKLAQLKDLTDPQISPNNPIHNVRIAPEIVDYVDDGRNPDIFTREFVENVQRGNAVINGKKQAFKDFSVIYAQKLKEGIGGVDRQVDRIMHNAGLDAELQEAMKKSKDTNKDNGRETENGGP